VDWFGDNHRTTYTLLHRDGEKRAGQQAGRPDSELAGPDPEDTPIGVKIHINASAIMAISVIN